MLSTASAWLISSSDDSDDSVSSLIGDNANILENMNDRVRRYESGASQPTLDVIRPLAVALQVSADVLIFGADERGPDGDLRLQFEAISKFASEEKKVIKALLEGMILKHEAKRWSSAA